MILGRLEPLASQTLRLGWIRGVRDRFGNDRIPPVNRLPQAVHAHRQRLASAADAALSSTMNKARLVGHKLGWTPRYALMTPGMPTPSKLMQRIRNGAGNGDLPICPRPPTASACCISAAAQSTARPSSISTPDRCLTFIS
jgi:hypothetical protein